MIGGSTALCRCLPIKSLRFGKELHLIDERDTTRTCHVCKCKKDMPLWVRTYRCANCGLVMDRAVLIAVNIYQRFLARLGPHT
jgi:putative transposase